MGRQPVVIIDRDAKIIAGGALVIGALVWWLTRKGNAASAGNAIGGAAVDLITGVATGAAEAVGGVAANVASAANDPSINPLQPVGSWIGTTIYDLTHSKEQGGFW